MTRVYRILRKLFSANPFDGEGAYRYGGRWSSPGVRVVYAAEHLSLAMIEYFVHIDMNDPPRDLVVVAADVPDEVPRSAVPLRELPRDWRNTPPPASLSSWGDDFIRHGKDLILMVPSVLAPAEYNWMINPQHPAFSRLQIHQPEPFAYDSRFFRSH